MTKYKHVSFDVWNTLLRPNKKFSAARNQMIADTLGVPVYVVSEQYTETKTQLDRFAKQFGLGCNTIQSWHMLIERMVQFSSDADVSKWKCDALVNTMFNRTLELFREHPPLLDKGVVEAIGRLYGAGVTMNIASNSNFVPGTSMQPFLKATFGYNTFSFFVFSDQIGMAKPSFQFFQRVKAQINLPAVDVVHVGDDERYDNGSELVGIDFFEVSQRHPIPWLVDHYLLKD